MIAHPKTTRRAPAKTLDAAPIYQAGGSDPNICHLLDEHGEPLCKTKHRIGGLSRDDHLIVGDKAKDSPCPACGRKRCEKCGEIATTP